ncbi:DUF5053 domain-containing protein [Phocaeicola sartorii]|uniref:DUF5053 domain-containing protein n=1 Tax=Phocaeicola sartorii TaxID=671267 RepID=UPI003513561E
MDKVKRFFELKELWKKSDESQRAEIDREMKSLLASFSPEDDALLKEGVQKDFALIHRDVADIEEQLVRRQMQEVLPILSVSYLAKHYFGKSTSWFYQRLNGNKVNGKVASFTREEIAILNEALQDISRKVGALSIS